MNFARQTLQLSWIGLPISPSSPDLKASSQDFLKKITLGRLFSLFCRKGKAASGGGSLEKRDNCLKCREMGVRLRYRGVQ